MAFTGWTNFHGHGFHPANIAAAPLAFAGTNLIPLTVLISFQQAQQYCDRDTESKGESIG